MPLLKAELYSTETAHNITKRNYFNSHVLRQPDASNKQACLLVLLATVCLVVAISDGDTITARCGEPGAYEQVKVRIAAIDAPERRQAFGNRARQALAELCHGQHATITQRSTDRYRRIVADVECQGHDAGSWMVRNGWAMVYRKYAGAHGHLYALEQAARHEMLGQWQMLRQGREPVEPWQWRQVKRHNGHLRPPKL